MTQNNLIYKAFSSHSELIEVVKGDLSNEIEKIGLMLAKTLHSGRTIFWCGNGGSAADSQHLAAELVGRFKNDRQPLSSLALTTDTSVLTCISNDYSYESIFSRQVEALARPGDVLIGISTSGNSENIKQAFKSAKKNEVKTVSLLGKDGGDCKSLADYSLLIPSNDTARIQEIHILIGHIFCEIIEMEMGFV
jgi:D-sedoheptulose 7-phosphate isomerase